MSLVNNFKRDQNNEYEGEVWRYLASENILKGQPLCWHLDGNNAMTASLINSQKEDSHYIGIALNDALQNEYVNVLTRGDVFCKRISTYPSPTPTNINLNSTTHNYVFNDLYVLFKDDGVDSNYSAGQHYKLYNKNINDTATWTISINSCGFEHTAYSLYDRLLLWTSDDGEVWTKANLNDWTSTSSTSEYGDTPRGSSSTPKNVLQTAAVGQNYTLNSRWLRWNFHSDSSSHYSGWEIVILSSEYNPASNPEDVAVNTPLYVSEVDKNCVINPQTTWSLTKKLGHVIAPTASNDKVKIRVNN